MISTEANFEDDIALLRCDRVKLPDVANFHEYVFNIGMYEEPREYKKAVKQYIKAVDKRILELVLHTANIHPNDGLDRDVIISLGQIRNRLDGHHWRAERIAKLYRADEARRKARQG